MPNRLPSDNSADPHAGTWVLIVAILGSAMAFIDGTVVNVSLPALQEYFQASGTAVQWVVEAYALLLASLLLVGGSLGDVYGYRNVYVTGVTVFAGASMWCGLSGSMVSLVLARALQGVGAAMLIPGSLSLITASFPEETRGKAIGTWAGVSAITTAIGPPLGGYLVQQASWRWVFFMNVPLALGVLVIASWKIPNRKSAGTHSLDWWGAVLATVGLGMLTWALLEAQRLAWGAPLLAFAGALLLAVFVWVESRVSNPMVPLGLFRSRNFAASNVFTLFLYAAIAVSLYYMPLELIQVKHETATMAGAALLPIALVLFALSRWSGGLVERHGPRLPLLVGAALTGLGMAMVGVMTEHGGYWTGVFPGILVLSLGLTGCVAPLSTVVMAAVNQDSTGAASGINNAASRVAGLLAIAVLGIVCNASFAHNLKGGLQRSSIAQADRDRVYAQRGALAAIHTGSSEGDRIVAESFTSSFRLVLLCCGALGAGAAASAALLRSQTSSEGGVPATHGL